MKKKKERTVKFPKKCTTIILIFVILLVGFLSVSAIFWYQREQSLFTVNHAAVAKQEYEFCLKDLSGQVRNHLMVDYNLSSDEFNWNVVCGEQPAWQHLQQQAVEQAAQIKVLQLEAQKLGILPSTDYADIQKHFKQENETRAERQQNNQVIYGLSQFSEEQFYEYLNSNLQYRLEEALQKNGTLSLTEEEMQQIYRENIDYFGNQSFETVENSVKRYGLNEKFSQYIQEVSEQAIIELKQKEVENATKEFLGIS